MRAASRLPALAATVILAAGLSAWCAEQDEPRRQGVIVVSPGGADVPMRVEVGGQDVGGAVRLAGAGPISFWNDPFAELVRLLEELNLTPHFNLSVEQKDQIQAIRDGVRQAQERWRREHEAEYQAIDEETRKLAQAGGRDVNAWRELWDKRRKIDQTAPGTDDAVRQLMLVLTDDQRKMVETRKTERKAAAEEQRRRMMEQWQRAGWQRQQPQGGQDPTAPQPAPRENR